MTRLIINADDYGLSSGVNEAIRNLFLSSALTSTSVMANLVSTEDLSQLAEIAAETGKGIGVHVNLTLGRALSGPSSLTDANGLFWDYGILRKKLVRFQVKNQDISTEILAQIDRIRQNGIEPTHVDSHQHVHAFPQVFGSMCRSAKAQTIPAMRTHRRWLIESQGDPKSNRSHLRLFITSSLAVFYAKIAQVEGIKMPDYMVETSSPGWKTDINKWLLVPSLLPSTISEIFVHPGIFTSELAAVTRYTHEREAEYEILMSSAVADAFAKNSIRLVSYQSLAE